MPTCVQLPAGTGWNRWRCNGKSLSPLAAPAFPRRSHSRQPARPDLRVCLQRRSVALPSALLYTFQGRRRQRRKDAFVVMFYSIFVVFDYKAFAYLSLVRVFSSAMSG